MTIDVPENNPPEKDGRSFEKLLKNIQPKLDRISEDARIAPLPPSEEVFESVKSYIAGTGLPVNGNPATVVSVAGEYVERAKLGVGRVGKLRGLHVFAFLYPEKKRFTVYGIFPRDGFDARRLGQAVYWGIVSDIPTHWAQSKPLSMDEFWTINAFDDTQLVDAPALQNLKAEMAKQRDAQIREGLAMMRMELAELKNRPVVPRELESDSSELKAANIQLHNSREDWKLAVFVLGFLALLLLVIVIRTFAA